MIISYQAKSHVVLSHVLKYLHFNFWKFNYFLVSGMEYQPVVIKSHARPSTLKHSPESRYWRQFKNPVFVKEYAPITSVHFSSSKPHRYAVTAATRVQIYAPRTQKITKTISRFKDVARNGNIREDGKLVVAGDDSGLVQVRTRARTKNIGNRMYSSGL